jgi:hypothetical protein
MKDNLYIHENKAYLINYTDIKPGDLVLLKYTKKRPWWLGGNKDIESVFNATSRDWSVINDDTNCYRLDLIEDVDGYVICPECDSLYSECKEGKCIVCRKKVQPKMIYTKKQYTEI